MRFVFAALALVCIQTPCFGVECDKLIQMHAYLSRAQGQCKFSKYNGTFLKEAKTCSPSLADARVKAQLAEGFKLFDQRAKERGQDKLCADILADFPNVLQK